MNDLFVKIGLLSLFFGAVLLAASPFAEVDSGESECKLCIKDGTQYTCNCNEITFPTPISEGLEYVGLVLIFFAIFNVFLGAIK